MLGDRQLLGFLLLVLVFIVSCSALPAKNSTVVSRKGIARSMGCQTKGNRRICKDPSPGRLIQNIWVESTNHFAYDLPTSGKYTSYTYCSKNDACVNMSTLSGSNFTPKNYQKSANNAISEFLATKCSDETFDYYPTAVDVYLNDENFVFSWYMTVIPTYLVKCDGTLYR